MISNMIKKVLIASALLFTSILAHAVNPINTGGLLSWGNTAIKGYDPVAYFTESRAVEGNSNFKHEWMGATWHFSSKENRDLFAANPKKYAPQYGGYCAYAVAQNTTASIDPTQFTVLNGKLYLNYSKYVNEQWNKERSQYIIDADKNWPKILDK